MKTSGFARNIGVSNFTTTLLDEAVRLSTEPLVTNQIEWHPFLDQSKVRAACARYGIAVTAYSPIAKGKAAGDKELKLIGLHHRKTAAQVSPALPYPGRCHCHSANLQGRTSFGKSWRA